MYPAQFHLDRMSLRPEFWYVCLQVHPTIVSHFELISARGKCIHLFETVVFARHFRTPSFVAARIHAVHDLLFCASWPAEQFLAEKRSTSRIPSVLNPRVKEEVSEAAFKCLSSEPSERFARTEHFSSVCRFSCFVV